VIVGRPNVGKSTLFNRLLGERRAVVSKTRGTTRDRLFGDVHWGGRVFTLVDTGGIEFDTREGLAAAVQRNVRRALKDADAFLLVCDAAEGFRPADTMVMDALRPTGKPVILAVNKAEDRLAVPPDVFSLGAADAFAVSALHGQGTGDLLDALAAQTASAETRPVADLSIAIVGRQNVGKSSLLNALLREERALVSDVPGTTRDVVEGRLSIRDASVALADTAGLRHRRKVKDPIDTFSMSRALEAINRCDVALAVLDATVGITRDDQRLLERVCEAGCGLIVLLNKWDLVQAAKNPDGLKEGRTLAGVVQRALPGASFAPVLAVSAKTGFQVPRVVTTALRVARAMRQGLSENTCTAMLREAWSAHAPPRWRGRAVRLERARWLGGRPARIELITRPIGRLPEPFERYLLKKLHAAPALEGVPVRLSVTGPNPNRRRQR
jgi:GTP-binding protein